MESDNRDTSKKPHRLKNIDWRRVIIELDALGADATVFVGIMDQSTRTHLRKGRVAYLNPLKYYIWTESAGLEKRQARLYMKNRSITSSNPTNSN